MLNINPAPEVEFQLISLKTPEQECQTLAIELLKPERLIGTHELQLLKLPNELDLQREVILYGRAPNWLMSHLVNCFRAAPWVACYDLRTQHAIVVSSRIPERQSGDAIPIVFNTTPGRVILIGGPPNSGKSVFSNALRLAITQQQPDLKVYLHRANWDGEGNHTYETPNPSLVERLRNENNRKLHKCLPDESLEKYFQDRGNEIERIQLVTDLVLVDVGGVPDFKKMPIVEQCTAYMIISRDINQVQPWHELCGQRLKLLAVIHSVLEDRLHVLQREPYLKIVAGPWLRDHSRPVPEDVTRAALSVMNEDEAIA